MVLALMVWLSTVPAPSRAAEREVVAFSLTETQSAMLRQTGAEVRSARSVAHTLVDPKHVAVIRATPDNLNTLVAEQGDVAAYMLNGGLLMLWGLTPDGLADFNSLTGYRHYIHELNWPIEPEFPALVSPLTGLAVYGPSSQTASTHEAMPFPYLFFGAEKPFRYLLSYSNITPFSRLILSNGEEKEAGHLPGNYNGFGRGDAFALDLSNERELVFVLPDEETINGLSLLQSFDHVALIRKIKVTFDDGATETVRLAAEGREQTVHFPLHRTRRVFIQITQPSEGRTGIRELKLRMQRPESFYRGVTPLLDEGGLIYYDRGAGGILLNQIDATNGHPDLVTAMAVVLKNMDVKTRHQDVVPLEREREAVRVLIRASSFGQPAMDLAAAMLAQHYHKVEYEFVTANHGSEEKSFQRNSFAQLVANGNFDIVLCVLGSQMKLNRLRTLLRGQAYDPVASGYNHFTFQAIRDAGAVPLLYSTWLHEREYWHCYAGNRPKDYPDLEGHLEYCATCKTVIELEKTGVCTTHELGQQYKNDYERMARTHKTRIVRSGEAFELSLARRPDLDLYLPGHDRMHASNYGIYLSACVVYAFLSTQSPLDLPDNKLTAKDYFSGSSNPAAKPEAVRHLQQCAWDCYRQLKREDDVYNLRIPDLVRTRDWSGKD